MTRTALRICPLCEATCGLTLTIDDELGRVTGARGDRDDVFSAGFICPKGASFAELDGDPDRLARPLVRRDGELTEVSWAEAFAAAADGLGRVLREHGGTSVAVYLGNPNAHTIAGALYAPLIIRGLGTHQVYSASTLDQMPKHVALGYLFGTTARIHRSRPRPHRPLVIIGANPLVSNEVWPTAADFGGKLKALRRRAALTVIDPNRTAPPKCRPAPRAQTRHRRGAVVRGGERAVRRGPRRPRIRRSGRTGGLDEVRALATTSRPRPSPRTAVWPSRNSAPRSPPSGRRLRPHVHSRIRTSAAGWST